MKKDEKFIERFKKAVDKIGGNDSAATVIGKSVKSIERYKAGGDPSFADVRALAMASGLPIEWLAFGLDEDLEENKRLQSQTVQLINLPVLDIPASSGNGKMSVSDQDIGGVVQLNLKWLKEMGIYDDKLFTIPTIGESMEPTIKAGEYLLCSGDENCTKVGDGIYVIKIDGNILVKRLQVMMDNVVIVSSDNSHYYKPFEIDLKKQNDFQVLGKVVLVHGIRWL